MYKFHRYAVDFRARRALKSSYDLVYKKQDLKKNAEAFYFRAFI